MWQRDASKQCLWMGSGQYRSRCRDATSNPNCFADSCVKRYSVRGGNTHAYGYCNSDGYTYGNSNGYGNRNAYSERNTDADTNIYGHANRLAYRYAQSDTKASANSASPAVSA